MLVFYSFFCLHRCINCVCVSFHKNHNRKLQTYFCSVCSSSGSIWDSCRRRCQSESESDTRRLSLATVSRTIFESPFHVTQLRKSFKRSAKKNFQKIYKKSVQKIYQKIVHIHQSKKLSLKSVKNPFQKNLSKNLSNFIINL